MFNKLFLKHFIILPLVAYNPFLYANLSLTIANIQSSVLAICAKRQDGKIERLGTGFVVGKGRQIVTNLHMLRKYKIFKAIQINGTEMKAYDVEVGASDPRHDLAILNLKNTILSPIPLSTCDDCVKAGHEFAFMGYPQANMIGLYPITHTAVVSAVAPSKLPASTDKSGYSEPITVYQLQANVYPGNSGSPVFNADTGQVVGVIYKLLARGRPESIILNNSGIGYAIPVKHVRALLNY